MMNAFVIISWLWRAELRSKNERVEQSYTRFADRDCVWICFAPWQALNECGVPQSPGKERYNKV